MNALEIKNLSKRFPGFTLDNLSLTLPSGCIMGLVGENGAGKSTTMKLILNQLHQDSGSITILGQDNQGDMQLTKESIGVVMDGMGFPECLTARQVGNIMQHTYRTWDAAEYDRLLRKLSVADNKPFKAFSQGMKRKLAIAVALAHDSKLLLLDEATSGLDPVVRDEVVELFYDFTRDETHSIFISSHIVSDLERLCDYIAFLSKGKLLLCEEKDRLLDEYGMIYCTAEQATTWDQTAISYQKASPYGVECIVKRDSVPGGIPIRPVTIEELFIFMVKEAH